LDAEAYDPGPDSFPDSLRAIERFGAERAIPGQGIGISIPREPEWLEAVVEAPSVLGRLLDAAAVRAGKNAAAMGDLGLRYCFGGGDFAGKLGPFYSPRAFRSLMVPRLRRISRDCHRSGVLHLFASDGDLWSVADDLFGSSGVDGFYEIDRNFMDLRRLRERVPRLVLLGGIRSEVLHMGTVHEVREETRSALSAAKDMGGCVTGCSNQIVIGTPEANFWTMMDTLHQAR
jgi:hypothetical protein